MKKRVDRKPWGFEDVFALNESVTVKILNVRPGKRFSLQKHRHRRELWRVLEGPAKLTIGRRTFRAGKGKEFVIKPGVLHRIGAYSKPVKVLEISFGKFDKNDIVRKEDDFGRAVIRKK